MTEPAKWKFVSRHTSFESATKRRRRVISRTWEARIKRRPLRKGEAFDVQRRKRITTVTLTIPVADTAATF